MEIQWKGLSQRGLKEPVDIEILNDSDFRQSLDGNERNLLFRRAWRLEFHDPPANEATRIAVARKTFMPFRLHFCFLFK